MKKNIYIASAALVNCYVLVTNRKTGGSCQVLAAGSAASRPEGGEETGRRQADREGMQTGVGKWTH